MKLWICTTNAGRKRTYARTKDAARRKLERHGLIVRSVRPGTDKDYPA